MENIPSGVVHLAEHPVRGIKNIGKSYAQTYGPLVHGQFGKFFHGVERHPLGPVLDVATLLTAGAGGLGRIGSLLDKAGAVSADSRIAQLAKSTHLTVPDFAESAGQHGEGIVVKRSSTNPLIRARQTFTNHMLNRLPPGTPIFGSEARGLKALQTGPARAGARLGVGSQPFEQSFNRLNKTERQAWHFIARGVNPDDYKLHLHGQPGFKAEGMLRILDNPKLSEMVANPSKRLQDALTKGRALSQQMTEAKVGAGQISEQTAAESPYHLLRLINGAKVSEPVNAVAPRVEQIREYPGNATSVTRAVTPDEAQARLAELDRQHDEMVNNVARAVNPHDNPQAVQLQRNFINSRLGKGRFLGTKRQPTVANEARAIAEQKIADAIQHNPESPIAQRASALMNEREHLQNELNAHAEQAFGGTRTADFGKVTQTVADKTRRVHLPAIEPQAAEGPAIIDRPGREIPVLAKELEQAGKPQPFYVPDSAETSAGRLAGFRGKASGIAEPMQRGSTRMNRGILANRGMLNLNGNALLRAHIRFKNDTEASLLHDELVKHAAVLPKGEALPHGYEYLKLNPGEATAPYTERAAGELEHGLSEPGLADRFLTPRDVGDLATSEQGHRLIVPSTVRQILTKNARTPSGAMHALLYGQPTSVWKHLVLGLRPAFFGNITIGNSILGALQMAPGYHGVAGWLNQVTPGLHHLLGSKLSPEVMREVLPEQATGTFGHSVGMSASRGMGAARRAYQGVMPATIAYETVLRRAMAEGWAKAMPEVRDAMKDHGGDINAAMRQVAAHHPQVVQDISRRIDDALGNYRNYSQFERKLRDLVPFYGWDRHIARSVARLVKERPATVNALTKVGAYGKQRNQQEIGNLPSFLQGAVKLPGLPKFMGPLEGRTPLLSTRSVNPFGTAADLATMAGALVHGQPGAHSAELSGGLNPIVQGVLEQITGRSLLTGAALPKNSPARGIIGNTAQSLATGVPQARLIAEILQRQQTKPTALYRKDWQTQLASLLGAPVKKTSLAAAAKMAAAEGKPRR